MISEQTTRPSAADLLDSLDPDEIQQRLTDLDREARALRVLYRSARARQTAARRTAKQAECAASGAGRPDRTGEGGAGDEPHRA